MCREPEEIKKKIVERLDARTILVRRGSAECEEVSNHADAEILDYKYDIEIENNGSFERFGF